MSSRTVKDTVSKKVDSSPEDDTWRCPLAFTHRCQSSCTCTHMYKCILSSLCTHWRKKRMSWSYRRLKGLKGFDKAVIVPVLLAQRDYNIQKWAQSTQVFSTTINLLLQAQCLVVWVWVDRSLRASSSILSSYSAHLWMPHSLPCKVCGVDLAPSTDWSLCWQLRVEASVVTQWMSWVEFRYWVD